jgi:hypothetical protein
MFWTRDVVSLYRRWAVIIMGQLMHAGDIGTRIYPWNGSSAVF